MSTSRVYRLLRVITMLQGGRSYTADELSAELQVSRRTVFRDLNMLELAHIPYYYDPQGGGYRISRHFFLPPINLTLPEALAVLALTGRLRSASKLPLLAHGARAAVKVESALPQAIRTHVGSVIEGLDLSFGPVSRHEGVETIFDGLAGAIASRSVCRLVYISFHDRKQVTLDVHPLRLTFLNRAWYLIAFSPSDREIRTYKLGRIRKLTATTRRFHPIEAAEVDKHFGQAWCMIPEGKLYDVVVRFDRQVAGNVAEVQWHPSQRIDWHDDGSIDFHARVDGIGEVSWWVLGYGDQAEVIAPAALRQRVARAAARMAERYASREGRP